jgi:hypothetical protein
LISFTLRTIIIVRFRKNISVSERDTIGHCFSMNSSIPRELFPFVSPKGNIQEGTSSIMMKPKFPEHKEIDVDTMHVHFLV